MRRAILCSLFAFCFSVSAEQQTVAEPYRGKTVRIIIPSGTVGNPDILGRLIAEKLNADTGGNFLVINRPGATGIIGNDVVAKARPDGHTLLIAPSSYIASVPHMHRKMPYDSLNDLVPVVQITTAGYVLVSHPSVPTKTVRELITLAKTKPGFLTFSSSGVGSGYHLAGEMINQMTGANMLHVPYIGAGAALMGLLIGEVDLMFASVLMVKPFAEAGRLRIVAVSGLRRDPVLPHPTLNESGLPGHEMMSWQGMFAPKGTPPDIIEYLNKTVSAILTAPEIRSQWKSQGMEFVPNTPAQFKAIVRKDYDRFGKLIRAIGIEPE